MQKMRSKISASPLLQTKLDRALEWLDRGQRAKATELLRALSKQFPQSAAVFGCLGRAYREAGDTSEAARAFGRAAKLNPKSELASLGLFHSLWDGGDPAAAMKEMKRFLARNESPLYGELLRDLVVSGELLPHERLLGAA